MNGVNISSNYVSDIIDEIALEGLDGITLYALWKRLSVRPNFCFKIDEHSKNFIWKLCTKLNDLKFYELPEPRPDIQHYDIPLSQKEYKEANIELDQLYPYCSVKNENGIFGSCQHYATRKDVSSKVSEMDLPGVEESYSNRLVVVASQECRNLALLGNNCPPNLDFSKSHVQYDILERIGRSRGFGVPTHGKGSLQSIVSDSKSIFHYLKVLLKHKIIKKQSLLGSLQTNPNGSNIYLMRFYGDCSNDCQLILQTAVEELKARPNYRMSYEEFYQLFDPEKRARVKKYCKNATFRKYIMVSKLLPYREFFPNATQAEWERKSQGGERMIRCFQLLDPNTEIADVLDKDCDSDEDDANIPPDFLTNETYFKDLPLLQQTYYHVKGSGSHGITIRELSETMGLTRSFVRSMLKRLMVEKHCICFAEINGRHRTKRYMVGENRRNIAAASEIFQILSHSGGDMPEKAGNGDEAECNSNPPLEAKVEDSKPVGEIDKKIDFQSIEEENVPYRTLRRIGMIIKTIKTHRYRLFFQIYRHILKEEMEEGLRATACRMTVNRILQKLEKDGLIKIVDITPKDDKTGSSVKLYVEPTFVVDRELMETILNTPSTYKPPDLTTIADNEGSQLERQLSGVLMANLSEMKKMLQDLKFKRERPSSKENKERELFCSPKFVRLNIIHDLVFHLVYEYTGVTDRPQEELINELSKTCHIDDELRKEMPKIYGTQLTSYLFVPPLTGREGIPMGWLLVSDILIRLPLSIFVKILRVNESTVELMNYLNHPIRKHFLIKDLPLTLRQTLFNRLRCMVAFIGDVKRLSFLGLIQFGAKYGKEQYQTLLYVNRNASLMDTTSSPPSYLYVPSDIKFPVKQYKFNNKADVKRYWQDMCQICLATNLGVKTSMIGKEVAAVREMNKESLRKYLEPKTASKAIEDDNGLIPGDHLGAAGLDSVLFSFLRSNWIGPITKAKEICKPRNLKKVPFQKLKKELNRKKKRLHLQKSRLKKLMKKPEVLLPKPILDEGIPTAKRIRKVKKRELRFKTPKKTYYDEVDLEALKLKNTLRVNWSPAEDHLLLICRVAMTYLCPNPRGLLRIPWSEVRSSLQKNLVESRDKTQKAVARRVKYMMKNQTTLRSASLCLEELKQLPELEERFGCAELKCSMKPSTPNLSELQSKLYQKFHELIDYIRERFGKGSSLNIEQDEDDLLPDSLDDFRDQYELEVEAPKEKLTLRNIRESVIRAILMSSLSCRADKTSSAIQLFEIYRQYEDDELHRAIKKLNADKVLAVRKVNSNFKNGRYLPLSHSPCKLSYSFQNLLNMKYSHSLYPDSYRVINTLLHCEDEGGFNVDLNECNVPLYVLASTNLVSFRTTIPEQIIVLDSGSAMDDNAYARMLKRYCEMLQFSRSDSKFVCSSGQLITTVRDGPVDGGRKRTAPEDDVSEAGEEEPAKRMKLESDEKEAGESAAPEEEKEEEKVNGSGCWRVVLYMMREEAKKEINNFTGNRAQEFFVVNASQVHCRKLKELEFYAKEMEPKVVAALVRNIISRYSVPLTLVSEESVFEEFGKQNSPEDLEMLKRVLDFIHKKKEYGASNEDLRLNFDPMALSHIIRYLVDSKIVIKTGIDETRYVGKKHSTPWLLNSFKVTRLEREKMKPTELSAVELPENSVSEDIQSVPKKKRKGIVSSEYLKSDDYTPPSCSVEESNKVMIIIRPWIRIDGSLNRKVLDRFLGTVLGFVMATPGITIRSVMDKFAPSLLPIWTKDLLEILHGIGCLSFTAFVVRKRATLFSKEEVITSEGFTGFEDDDSVIVEPKVDAVTTLGLFIGKRSYSKDFLLD